jgi:WhiB family redox-sensing transcriptional regulator
MLDVQAPDGGHGTRSRYTAGCRCGPCTEANRAYHRRWRNGPPAGPADRLFDALAEMVEARREQGWRARAACADPTIPVDLFFTAPHDFDSVAAARQVCAGCEVTQQCAAASADERYGVWAGTSPKQRQGARAGRLQ